MFPLMLASASLAALATTASGQDPIPLPPVVIATTPLSTVSTSRRPRARTLARPASPRNARAPAPAPAEPGPTAAPDPALIERDKIPSMVQSVTAEEIAARNAPTVTDTLFQRVPGVTLSDP
ncbi:MAG: hypothetical protein QOF91_2950, partial [Alphaproteobacteria bacterium]|nr:hypothetical protein [Alphaproteobacteria bacterium]